MGLRPRPICPLLLRLFVGVVLGGCSDGVAVTTVANELDQRLGGATQRERFTVDYEAIGSGAIDCFLPNRRFSVDVDREAGTMGVRLPADPTRPVAHVAGDSLFLRRELVTTDAEVSEWLTATLPVPDSTESALAGALGDGLAGFLLAPGLPPGGQETALATLEIARRVERLPSRSLLGRDTGRYRLTLDMEELADEAAAPLAVETPGTLRSTTVELWIDPTDRVVRVVVVGRLPASDSEGAVGWIADYGRMADRVGPAPSSSVSELDALDPATLRPPTVERCELGGARR